MIVVYGTLCLDRFYRLMRLPAHGSYEEVEDRLETVGGEAANTSLALASWGNVVLVVSNPIGTSQEAKKIVTLLKDHGVADVQMPLRDIETPVCTILVTPEGERTMFGYGFKQMESVGDPSLVPHQAGAWLTADSNHGPQARKAVWDAHRAGMRTYLMDFVHKDEPIPEGCWWQSSTSWAEYDIGGTDPLKWVGEFALRNKCHTVLTHGPDGLSYADPHGNALRLPAFKMTGVVDTTGAGDVFRAGMLHALTHDWPTGRCLMFASMAAALNCLRLGAAVNVATVAMIERAIAEQPDVASQFQRTP